MKRSQQSVPNAMTGTVPTDQGFANNSHPQGIAWKNKGGRNATTNEAKRGAGGMAPKPSGGAALPGNDRPSHPVQGSMARVRGASGAPRAGSFTPVQNNAMANLLGQATGQAEVAPRGPGMRIGPQTKTPATGNPVATNKPRRKGLGSAFYGDA